MCHLFRCLLVIQLALWMPPTVAAETPLVIAHRGASGYLPEHTSEATVLAHGMGADFIEQDLVLTQDGIPIVLHDIHLEAVTDVATQFPKRRRQDGRWYAIDLSLDEIRQLRVHERSDPDRGQQVYPGRFPAEQASFAIPTLAEAIQLIQGLNRSTGREVGIYPEIKAPTWHRAEGQDISRIVLDVLDHYGYDSPEDAVFLQCFDSQELRRIRGELGSSIRLVQLLGDSREHERLRTTAGLAEVARYAAGIGPRISDVLAGVEQGRPHFTELVSRAHRQGLVVHPYTFRADALPAGVSSFTALHQIFRQAQIDGLFSDFPDQSVRMLRSSSPAK